MPVWLLNIVIGLVISLASTLIQQALSPKREEQARGFRGSVQTGGRVPQSFLAGTIGVAGKLEYRNTWGTSGQTPNAYLVDVISFGDLPVSDFVGLYVNSQAVTVEGSGHVTQGFPVTEYDNGSDHLWAEFFDGSQTTANTYLSARFGSDPDRPWLSDMVGRGVPYLTLTALVEETLWTGFPVYMAVFEGVPLYDIRDADEAGGDGDQEWADPSTWLFSDNNMVVIYNVLRGIQYDGGRVWGGEASEAQLPYAAWAAAMDACDADVDLDGGGSEKRFRCGREIFFSERPADVIQELLTGCNGRLVLSQGKYYPLVGVPETADASFTDADVIVTEATSLEPFPNLDSIINGATASYLEPSQAWESKETAPYKVAALVAADDGREQLEGLDLATTFSGTQAQRILKAVVEESRRFRRHVVPLPPAFNAYRPLQVLSWTSAANGYTDKLFLITAKTEAPNANVVFGLLELDPADFDWDETTDEQPLSFAPLTPIRPAAQEVPGFAVAPGEFIDNVAASKRQSIEVEWDGGLDDVRAVRVQVILASTPLVFFDAEIPYDTSVPGTITTVLNGIFLQDTDYEVRAKLVPFSGRRTDWTDWEDVTTDAISEELTPGSVGTTELADNAVTTVKINALAVTAAKIGSLAVESAKINTAAVETLKIANAAVTGFAADTHGSGAMSGGVQTVRMDVTVPLTTTTPARVAGIFDITPGFTGDLYVELVVELPDGDFILDIPGEPDDLYENGTPQPVVSGTRYQIARQTVFLPLTSDDYTFKFRVWRGSAASPGTAHSGTLVAEYSQR